MQNEHTSGSSKSFASSPLDQYSVQPSAKPDESPFYKSAAPGISLPKGGGAIKGIDEKFSVNAVNGTAGLEIPLPLSPGRGGFTPSLSLSYNSGGGNGEFGLGFSLGLPSIQRRTDKQLPLYNDSAESDVFLLAGAEDLVPMPTPRDANNQLFVAPAGLIIKYYRPRIEGLFARIEYIKQTGGTASWWRVTTKDNITTYYGLTAEARIADPEDDGRIFKWLPQLTVDHKGNAQQYVYKVDNNTVNNFNITPQVNERNRLNGIAQYTNTYLKNVLYCNKTPYFIDTNVYTPALLNNTTSLGINFLMEAVFDYGDHNDHWVNNKPTVAPTPSSNQNWPSRSDAFSGFHAGFEIRTYRKCRRVLMFHHFDELQVKNSNGILILSKELVRSLELSYKNPIDITTLQETTDFTEADFITSATQRGYRYDDTLSAWQSKTLPAMTFHYQPLQWDTSIHTVNKEDFKHAPQGLTGPYQWMDFEGEGISGILTEQAGGWFYKNNVGDGHFDNAKSIASKPNFTGLGGNALQWQDLDADGRRQVVASLPTKGFWELDDDQQWQPFRTFAKNLNIDWNSPFTKMLDLNGDGKPDVIITEDRAWTWYENKGKTGFDIGGNTSIYNDEEKGPRLLLRDAVQSIFLADMSGDGMTDLVRIKNGEICYWPNKGYGKFGAKVAMANAPVFQTSDLYNPLYLSLADISGTGAADLIYVGKNKCTAWINFSGNAWGAAIDINPLPATDAMSKIAIVDFLGNGTACIVWSSPLPHFTTAPMQYIDLMGGVKPYLMLSYDSGMGKTVSVTYKSSTQFYLADKLAGNPWITKLPFPVHVISKVTTEDHVSQTCYSQTYKYRHGYYDHEEREFRGFGYVETQDIDTAASGNAPLDQNPVLTKTWNHTGAWIREQSLSDQYKKEYFRFDQWDDETNIATFPDASTMNPQEWREAHRALKGSPLRHEVYALDGDLSAIPFTVTATAYLVKKIQPQGSNRYACFMNIQQQSVAYSSERQYVDVNVGSGSTAITTSHLDVRIAQQLTLETDDYGNVTKSASIAYPRQYPSATVLPDVVHNSQFEKGMHISYSENTFTNDKIQSQNYYRLRVGCEAKSYEVLGYIQPTGLWTIANLMDFLQSLDPVTHSPVPIATIDFTATPTGAHEKRLLSHSRVYFMADDAITPLTLYTLDTLAIPYQQYHLAYSNNDVNYCFDIDGAGSQTTSLVTPSMLAEGNYIHLEDTTKYWIPSGTAEYKYPRDRFYTPTGFYDPWGNETQVSFWGSYWLLPQSTSDALGNTNTVNAYDWRILQPTETQDLNDNISQILYDDLGMPVAMALKGKNNPAAPEGDNLNSIAPDSTADLANQSTFWANSVGNETAWSTAAENLLNGATWRCVYNLSSFPASVGMIAREYHVNGNHPSDATLDNLLVRISYSDAMGRVMMHKVQAEPDATTPTVAKWIGSGRTIYNNKGNAVMQYEPYFSTNHLCDTAEQAASDGAISPQIHYDALGRVYRTDMPDGTFSKTTWTAWEQIVYDTNDTVKDSTWYTSRITGGSLAGTEETDAATKAALHYSTPTVMHIDTLGRPFYTIQQSSQNDVDAIPSYVNLDVSGNRLSVVDGLGRTPLTYRYNMLKQVCYQHSIDSGEGYTFTDIAGQPLYAWDAASRRFKILYDSLRRVTAKLLDSANKTLEKMTYGEANYPAAAGGNPKTLNMRGQVYERYDGSGKQWMPLGYDFKGNPVQANQSLLANKTLTDADWNVLTTADISTEVFTTTAVLDALGRPTLVTDPGGNVNEYLYDKAGALKKVKLNATTYVQDIHYDAKGQRQCIWYGNNTKTSYTYDPFTYRLRRLLTVNLNPDPDVFVQDLNYYYDPVGNITTVRDDAQAVLFTRNSLIDKARKFTYDALYRLTAAFGREQPNTSGFGLKDNTNDSAYLAGQVDTSSVQNYTQTYTYDAVGNITKLVHAPVSPGNVGGYTRNYNYATGTNRLTNTIIGSNTYSIGNYDAMGNMLSMPHLTTMNWNASNELNSITNTTTMAANYQYTGGHRVRKYVVKDTGKEERIYLGSYEIYRKFDSSGSLKIERTTVHISDDTGRIAMEEKRTIGVRADDNDTEPLLSRYIYNNHLQSASLELDTVGAIISYEEYHPYGTTAYLAMSATIKACAKRYRYTGKERDEESGLYYHGARYYIPWLGRWCASDPLESKYAGWSPYHYVKCNPVMDTDSTGMGGDNDVPATSKVTPEVAGNILENVINGDPHGFEPSLGKGGASWFLSEGNPHTGTDASKSVTIGASINTEGSIQISSEQLVEIFDKISNDPAFQAKIEGQIRGKNGLLNGEPLNKKMRDALKRNMKNAAESEMWEQVAGMVQASESGVGEVTLKNSKFSQSGDGKFLVVTDRTKITVNPPEMVMAKMSEAGLDAPVQTQEALQITLQEAKQAGKYTGATNVRSAFRIGGQLLTVVGAAADGYRLLTATDRTRTAVDIAGGWSGAAAAASAFSAWFAPADTAGPLAWAAHGIGVLAASAIGYMLGSGAASSIYEIFFPNLPNDSTPKFKGFGGGQFGGGGAGGQW